MTAVEKILMVFAHGEADTCLDNAVKLYIMNTMLMNVYSGRKNT